MSRCRHTQLGRAEMLAALLALDSLAWVTRSQSKWGVGFDAIRAQMAGDPNVPRDARAELGSLWSWNPHQPSSELGSRGLGGGITWAWDDDLCSQLLGRFHEDIIFYDRLVDCSGLKAAAARAFSAWSANNRHIHFIDVTSECEKLGQNFYSESHRPAFMGPNPSRYSPNKGSFHGGCPLAEIWVTSLPSQSENDGNIAVARAFTYEELSTGEFYFTNGVQPFVRGGGRRPIREAYAGRLEIAVSGRIGDVSLCWYLDSYFCSGFHRFKESFSSPGSAKSLLLAICWLTSVAAILYLFFIKCKAVTACCNPALSDKNTDGVVNQKDAILAYLEEVASWSPIMLAVLFTLIIAPPLVVHKIILPCWDCIDFEAAVMHEAGHFLGLGHPDNIPDNLEPILFTNLGNLYNPVVSPNNTFQTMLAAGGRTNLSNCFSLWEDVGAGIPPSWSEPVDIGQGGYPVRSSVMEAFTQHNPKVCLTADDVEALSTLYPDCSTATSRSAIVCHKVNHNIGLVRVLMYVLVPGFLCLIIILIFDSVINAYQEDSLEHAQIKLEEAKKKAAVLTERAASLQKTVDEHGGDRSRRAFGFGSTNLTARGTVSRTARPVGAVTDTVP